MTAMTTTTELAAWMGRTFDTAQEAQAQMILDQIEVYISRTVGIGFGETSDHVATYVADGQGLIELPLQPVTEVSSVTYLDARPYRDGWGYNSAGTLYGITPGFAVIVTYTYGYATLPDDLKGVVLGMASRQAYNPTGVRQKTVGSESVTYSVQSGGLSPSPMEREVLESYRGCSASWRLVLDEFPGEGDDYLPVL